MSKELWHSINGERKGPLSVQEARDMGDEDHKMSCETRFPGTLKTVV